VVEWKDSLPVCQKLAKRMKWELVVVRRKAGDLMDRANAKKGAEIRVAAEARLPKHLLFTAGWPEGIPTLQESKLIADVRLVVSKAVNLEPMFVTAKAVRDRYAELVETKIQQQAA
jgi:hypothetical protein